jgi:hypothetical protein
MTSRLKFSAGLFYIKGKGYYEQYKADQAYTIMVCPNLLMEQIRSPTQIL